MGGDEESVLDEGMLGFSDCALHKRALSARDMLFRTERDGGISSIFGLRRFSSYLLYSFDYFLIIS